MEEFVNFIKEYGAIILAALSAVLGFVCMIIKKRPKTLDEFLYIVDEVLKDVPYMVSIEEMKVGSGHGDQKKALVLTDACKRIKSKLGRDLSKEESDYCLSVVSSMVEAVLDTPQKKGVE